MLQILNLLFLLTFRQIGPAVLLTHLALFHQMTERALEGGLADLELVNCMNQAVLANGQAYDNGVTCTMDGFYSQMRQTDFSRKLDLDVQDTFIDLKRYGIVGIDMESSVILTLSRLMGIRGCVVTLTTVLENLKASIQGEARKEAERMLCKVVLDGIVQLDKEGKI